MNKATLGTILGAALLGLAKSKGSSARKVSIEEIINKSTDGTGKVRVDFSVKIKPFWDGNELICDFDDELVDAQASLKVFDYIEYMSKEWTVDDYNEGWYGDTFGNPIDQEGVEWYREHPEELYIDYLGTSHSYEREYYLFRSEDDGRLIFIKEYLDWHDLEDFVGLFNLSERIRLNSWNNSTKIDLAEDDGCEFEQDEWGWEPIGFDYDKYESLNGPRSLVEGYVEFNVRNVEDYFFIKKSKYEIKEYIQKMLQIAYDIKKKRTRVL
jgi:hypothetical protein